MIIDVQSENKRITMPLTKSQIALGMMIICMLLAGCGPHTYTGTTLEPPKAITDFTMQTDEGGEFRLSDLGDRSLLVYFGYTYCPDICPTTLYKVRQAMQQLGDDAQYFQVAMITVDPERDTPDVLNKYMKAFDPSYIGLYEPDTDKLSVVLADFGVFAEKDPPAEDGSTSYTVSHSSYLFLVDQSGMRLIFSYETSAEDLAADLKATLNQK
jgi:protein SCO1